MNKYPINRLLACGATAAIMSVALQAMAFPVEARFITGANQGWKSFGNAGGAPPPVDWSSNSFDDSTWAILYNKKFLHQYNH